MANLFQTEFEKAKLNLAGLNTLNQPTATPTAGNVSLGPIAPTVQGPTQQVKSATATAPQASPTVAGAMTPAQISAYYASQANATNALSPAQWLAQQGGTTAPATTTAQVPPPPLVPETVTKDDIPTTGTPDMFNADVSPFVKQQKDFMAQQQKLQQDFLQAQTPTAQEQALTEQMNKLNADARQAIFAAEGSGETQRFAAGETARVSRQATIQLQGIADQLNTLVNQRSVQVDALKSQMQFSKENFDALQNLSKLTRPDVLSTKVASNGDVYSIVQNADGTVDTIKSGNIPPDPADSKIEWKQFGTEESGYSVWGVDEKGNIITKRLSGGAGGGATGGGAYTPGVNPAVDSWVNLINSGGANITTVPANLKNAVATALATATPKTNELAQAQASQNITTIDSLKNARGINKAVGATFLGRWTPFKSDVMTGDVANFIGGVEQIVSTLTLDSLINAKARGATFGALSEKELGALAASASKIGTWRKEDDEGNVIGYAINEKGMKIELDKISNFAKLDYVLKGGEPSSVGIQQTPDGKLWSMNSDGSLTQLR